MHPTLNKRGFYKKDATSPYVESPMTYEQLAQACRELEQGRQARHQAREIVVLDVLDQTAVVKLTASWGIDFMFLRQVRRQVEDRADSLAEPSAEDVGAISG